MLIGAHVPTGGRGLIGVIERAQRVGAEAVQAWGSNPRAWALPRTDPSRDAAFVEAWSASRLRALFLHAPYMVNIASPDPGFRRRSVDLARATVALAERIGADGVVVHAGAGGAATPEEARIQRAARSLAAIAAEAARSRVLVELMAGTAGAVASTFEEARRLFDACLGETGSSRGERLGLCLDTCHLFAAGYALDTAGGVRDAFAELRRVRLAGRVRLVHANDSRFPQGARRDAHTNIGRGHIGERGFEAILAEPVVRRAAVVCETPGTPADTARDVATLRRLAGLDGESGTRVPG
jgi:deoxyribonuclease-4